MPMSVSSPATVSAEAISGVRSEATPQQVYAPSLESFYPDRERRAGIEGRVLLEVQLSDNGTVARVRVVKSSGNRSLDQAAQRAMRAFRFSPQDSTRPTQRVFRFPIRFQLY